MKWFKHMMDASRDEKIVALRLRWGREGVCRWWEILEMICEQMDLKTDRCEVRYMAGFISRSLGFRSTIDCRSFVDWLAINRLLIVDLSSNEWLLKCPNLLKIRARKNLIGGESRTLDIEEEVDIEEEPPIPPKGVDLNLKDFEENIWKSYQPRNGIRGSKKKAQDQWKKLTEEEKQIAILSLHKQKAYYKKCKASNLFIPEFPDVWRWLRDKRFKDEIVQEVIKSQHPTVDEVMNLSTTEKNEWDRRYEEKYGKKN